MEEAVSLQRQLAGQVDETDGFDPETVRTVGGIDVSLKEGGQAAVAVLSLPDLTVVEQVVASAPITFPYVPGLLSFREAPLILTALQHLRSLPDLLMVDGQGRAHPRRFGIACHIGVLTGLPSIGVAKSVLAGKYSDLGDEAGDTAPLLHRGETIGMALRNRVRTNPLIISVGHRVSLPTAVAMVRQCSKGYRLPEPTRAAHRIAGTAAATPDSAEPAEPAG